MAATTKPKLDRPKKPPIPPTAEQIRKRQAAAEHERFMRLVRERVAVHQKVAPKVDFETLLNVAVACVETKAVLEEQKKYINHFFKEVDGNRMWWNRQMHVGQYAPFQSLTDEQKTRMPTKLTSLDLLTRVPDEHWPDVVDTLQPDMTKKLVYKAIEDVATPIGRPQTRPAIDRLVELVEKLATLLEQDPDVVDDLSDYHLSLIRDRINPAFKDL